VQSLLQLSFAGFGIAALPLGLLAEAIGRRQAMVVMGLAATVAIVVYWVLEGSDAETIEGGIPHEPAPAPSERPPSSVSYESTRFPR
jgi:MFS family permease